MDQPNELKSDWKTAAKLANELEKGDLVEIWRASSNVPYMRIYVYFVFRNVI